MATIEGADGRVGIGKRLVSRIRITRHGILKITSIEIALASLCQVDIEPLRQHDICKKLSRAQSKDARVFGSQNRCTYY